VVETMLGAQPHPEVRAAAENAAKLMESLGHQVEPTQWPVDGPPTPWTSWRCGPAAPPNWSISSARRSAAKPDDSLLEPFTLAMAELVGQMPPDGLRKAVANLNAAGQAYDRWFDRYDVIVSPVLGKPPAPLGWVAPTVDIPDLTERLNAYVGYTTLHNVAGAASMSVPLHWTADGLPVGVQFAGRAGAERTLLELAYELEAAQPWAGASRR
jgi:amidase